MYYALDFIFDGKPSIEYGLKIMEINGNARKTGSGGLNLDIVMEQVADNQQAFISGVGYGKPLEFNLTISSFKPMDSRVRSAVQRWLFGHRTMKKLQFVQGDMQNIYFNCILNNPKVVSLGGVAYSFEVNVVCDSSYAWERERVYSYTTNKFNLYNTSDIMGYVKPKIRFEVEKSGDVEIKNLSNKGRVTSFKGLNQGEIITMDNSLGIIESSNGLLVLDKFNKNLFELVPYLNQIETKNISRIVFRYSNALRVGG